MMTEEANEQLYGNDPAFFVRRTSGPKLKYSACEWPVDCGATDHRPDRAARARVRTCRGGGG